MAADLDNQSKAQSGEATENKESSPSKTALSETYVQYITNNCK